MEKHDYIESSGNVFDDLKIPGAEEMLAKAELVQRIVTILQERKLTQVQAAEILKVDQPKISTLIRGRLTGFSIERLLRFLLLLGSDVTITIEPRGRFRSKVPMRAGNRDMGASTKGRLIVDGAVTAKAS